MIELFKALALAQSDFPVIPKDKEVKAFAKGDLIKKNPIYTYWYADLTTVIEKTRPSLAKYGLGFTQSIVMHDQLGPCLATTIFHSSGEKIELAHIPFVANSNDMKALAANITFAKRISLNCALGISADDDIDAAAEDAKENKPSVNTTRQAQKPITNHAPRPKPQPKTEPAQDDLDAFIGHSFLDELVKFTKDYMIPPEVVTEAIERITGEPRKASTLSDEQLNEVMNYLALKYV